MPWYAAGTITVAASGTTATGTGTAFLGNVRVGDGIAIQGSSSLHEVTGVTSDTQLTFAPPYAGAAGGGKAYRVAPVLGYDKDLSDAFNALRLQFGDQLSSLSPWATAITTDAALDELGFGATGKDLAVADDAGVARSVLWADAAEASAALDELGFGTTGKALAEAATPDAALDELGFGAAGKAVATAATPNAARTALYLGDAAIANVVGTMASGAIIERGTNTNGEYVRYADGTQICTKRRHSTVKFAASAILSTWTLPAAFMNTNYVGSCTPSSTGDDVPLQARYGFLFFAPSAVNTVNVGAMSNGEYTNLASGDPMYVHLIAIGRWK